MVKRPVVAVVGHSFIKATRRHLDKEVRRTGLAHIKRRGMCYAYYLRVDRKIKEVNFATGSKDYGQSDG